MSWRYALSVRLYQLAVALASPFSAKAKLRHEGARAALASLEPTGDQSCFWMHCASVGEFEQGRPLWQRLMRDHPEARFVLSFFSPSGYEQYRQQAEVGEVVYLPFDTTAPVRRQSKSAAHDFVAKLFGSTAQAEHLRLAIFVKYEWWFGYFSALGEAQVPLVMISVILDKQWFISDSGGRRAWRAALQHVDQVFAQNERTVHLLQTAGNFDCVTLAGDTRHDRTVAIRSQPLDAPRLEVWAQQQKRLLVAGSTWPADEALLAEALTQLGQLSLLLAPHEVGAAALAKIKQRFDAFAPQFLSELDDLSESGRVIIVDSLGLLAKLYRLGELAYVGGGFGAGIHNIVEPVTYGLPVAFGPKFQKFQEAHDLLKAGVATAVEDAEQLVEWLQQHDEEAVRGQVLAEAERYVQRHTGATDLIYTYLRRHNLA